MPRIAAYGSRRCTIAVSLSGRSIAVMSSQPARRRVLLRGFITACQVKRRSRRVQRRAVGPAHAVAQVQHDRLAVAADAAVALRRNGQRHLRHVVARIVVAEDRRGDQVRDLVAGIAVGEELVERVRFFGAGEAQAVGLRPRVQAVRRRSPGRRACSRSKSRPAASAHAAMRRPRSAIRANRSLPDLRRDRGVERVGPEAHQVVARQAGLLRAPARSRRARPRRRVRAC